MVFVVPGEIVGLIEIAKARAVREEKLSFRPTQTEHVRNGKLLEVLVAEYLAGPEEPPSP
jgi:hypothetical protein